MVMKYFFPILFLCAALEAQTVSVSTLNLRTLNGVFTIPTNTLVIGHSFQSFICGQTSDMIVIPNPKDSTRLVAVFDGLSTPGGTNLAIGTAWAYVNHPNVWFLQRTNPVFAVAPYIRCTDFEYDTNTGRYFLFYDEGWPGVVGSRLFNIDFATSPCTGDGFSTIAFTPDPGNPVLTNSADESFIAEGNRIKIANNLYLITYTWLATNVTATTGFEANLRGAISTNGTNGYTKIGDVTPTVGTGTNASRFEWHQMYGSAGFWWMPCEEGQDNGARWHTRILYNTNAVPTNLWTLANSSLDDQTNWAGYSASIFNVATPAFFTASGNIYQVYQVTTQTSNYGSNSWDQWVSGANNLITVAGGNQIYLPTVNTNF
jgi:hypothetical protein